MTPGSLEKVAVSHRGSDLEIVLRWFEEGRTIPRTVWVVIFNAFTGFLFFNMSARVAMPSSMDDISLIQVVPGILLAAGIICAYTVAAAWLNWTSIVVNRETLSVRHGPLPWPGNKVVAVAEFTQLHATRSRWVSGNRMNRKYRFDLYADKQDGGSIRLAGGFETEDQALSVKQEIEKYLSLKPVQPTPTVALGPGAGGTNIQSVVGIWLFILVWNGFTGWVVMLVIQGDGWRQSLSLSLSLLSPFVLIGLGLIYLAIPPTVAFFRQKSSNDPGPTDRKSGWGPAISMVVIAGGFIFIAMQAPEPAQQMPAQAPLTPTQIIESNKANLSQSLRTQMGAPQPATFFEGMWRRHGLLHRHDVRRVGVRSDGGDLHIRVWTECNRGAALCDAGEFPAIVATRPGGLIESFSAQLTIPEGGIWLRMSSGNEWHQPATMVTMVNLTNGSYSSSGTGSEVTLAREKPAAPLAEFVGEWSNPSARKGDPVGTGHFTRLTVRQTGPQALAIRVWAVCLDGNECDRGEAPAQMELEPDGMVREVKVGFSGRRNAYLGLTVILEPPYKGQFEAVSMTKDILAPDVTMRGSYTTVRVDLARGHP